MQEAELHEKIADASKLIFSYCMAKTASREDAEDLSQDILYELIKSSGNLRDDNAFYGFMWAIADNIYKTWLRKKKRLQTVELQTDIPDDDETELLEMENRDMYLLRRELSLLSEKYRKATILYYVDKKSCVEVAETLHITESMVKYLLFKSRKILKEGMNMDRKLGALSYNPKNLIPLYSGEGPNCFSDFMQSKIRQNIVGSCYNDSLTRQQISMETGIPLPYIDDEIEALVNRNLLIKDGTHYKANVILVTADCQSEILREAAAYHEKIADALHLFVENHLAPFQKIPFQGNHFSENALRIMLTVLLFRSILRCNTGIALEEKAPLTGWGERAYICLVENTETNKRIFHCGSMKSKYGDELYFFDYLPKPHGDYRDFYGNDRFVNILSDMARGRTEKFSEYDWEAVGEMLRLGYLIKENETYRFTVPIYTKSQYEEIKTEIDAYTQAVLYPMITALNRSAVKILRNHTPKHLQKEVAGVASMDKMLNVISIPLSVMLEKGYMHTDWNAYEMPTAHMVLEK